MRNKCRRFRKIRTYADTVVIEKEGNISYLAAVRMGGYPESVKGMSEAIYGGGSVTIEINGAHGVTESVYEIAAPDYNSNRRTAKKKIRERQLPGVSPLVYSRFLMDSAAFLSLNDMGKDLPDYEEMPI